MFTALLVQHFPLAQEAQISREDLTGGTFQSQPVFPALTPAVSILRPPFFPMYSPGSGDPEDHPQAHVEDGHQPSGLACPSRAQARPPLLPLPPSPHVPLNSPLLLLRQKQLLKGGRQRG